MSTSNQSNYDPPTQLKRVRRKLRELQRVSFLWVHGTYWRFLFALGIGWTVSRVMCRLGIYNKFRSGACMFCGNVHPITHQRKEI